MMRQDRHKVVTLEDTEHCIKDNRNKNTCTKTKSGLKMFYEWFLSNGEMRMIEDIPFPELDELLARLYLGMFGQNFIRFHYFSAPHHIPLHCTFNDLSR